MNLDKRELFFRGMLFLIMKKNKLVSTAALALTGMATATGTQVIAHADTVAPNQSTAQSTVVTKSGDATPTSATAQSATQSSQSTYDAAKQSEKQKMDDLNKQNKDKENQASQANDQQYAAKSDAATSASSSMASSQASDLNSYDAGQASQAAAKSDAASQAVNSYANSQQAVASQAASQSATDTTSYANSLANDPAKTADEARQAAKDQLNKDTNKANTDYSNAQSAANSAQQDANQKATDTKNQADANAANDYANANQKTADTKSKADKAAQDAKDKAIKDAGTKKNTAETNATNTKANADKQAKDKQTKDTNAARAERDKGLDKHYQSDIDNATSSLQNAQQAVTDAEARIPVTATPAYSADGKAALTKGHVINNEGSLPTVITNPNIPVSAQSDISYDYYGWISKNDNSEVINGDLTDSQQKELADYAVTLVNSWRTSQGLAPVVWSQQVQDATVAIMKLRQSSSLLGMSHTYTDDNVDNQVKELSNNYGLSYDRENLASYNYDGQVTMASMKADILNLVSAMIYQDGGSSWGHRKTFQNAIGMGFAAQYNTKADKDMFPYVLVFETFDSEDGKALSTEQTSMTNNAAQEIQAVKDSFGPTKAQLQAVTDGQTAVANAKKAMNDALGNKLTVYNATMSTINKTFNDQMTANDSAYQSVIKNAETTYANEIATANTNYANAMAYNDATAKASYKSAEDTRTAQLAKAQSNYDSAVKQAQTVHDTAIAQATATHDEALKTAQSTYETAYNAAHDETPAERDARHAKMMDAFKASEADKLAKLATQQASDLKAFKAEQDKDVADFIAKQAEARKAYVAKQGADLKAFDAKQAKELADYKQSLDKDYAKLVATDKASYEKAQKASDKYLDSLKPKSHDNGNTSDGGSTNGGSTNGNVGKKTTDGKGNTIYAHGDTATIPSRSGETHYSEGDNYATGHSTDLQSQTGATGYVYDPATHQMIAVHYDAQGNAVDANGRVVVSAESRNHDTVSQSGTSENQTANTTAISGTTTNASDEKQLNKLPQTGDSTGDREVGFGAVMLSALLGIMTAVAGTRRRRHE